MKYRAGSHIVPTPSEPPEISDDVSLARYPFLPQASSWIEKMASKHAIDLDELLEGRALEMARRRARMRLIDTVDNKEGVDAYAVADIHTESGKILEAFSFYYARLVVCASGDERLVAKWAQAEAVRAEKLLASESDLITIAKTYLSEIKQTPNNIWQIGMADFIEICPTITGSRWRLANCDVTKGWVTLHDETTYNSSMKLARLLREKIKEEIVKEAKNKIVEITPELEIRLAEPIGMVVGLITAKQNEIIDLTSAGEEDWPPCMRNIVVQLADAVNVNHYGRVFLGAIARTIGLPRETTVNFFRNAPDFNESTTTYQVNHLYDHEYTPSGCPKLKVNHNCPVSPGDDSLCDQAWMDHPLKYTRAKQRRKRNILPQKPDISSNNKGDA